jgi:hypothetical protein
MNDRGIMRVSKDQLAEMIDETDWARVAAMTEADIERAAAEDPDASLTTAGDWKDARVVWPQTMEPVTLRLDRARLVSVARTGLSGTHQCGPSPLRQGARARADPRLRRVQNVRTMSAHRDRLLRPPDLVSRCSGVPEREVGQFLTSSLEEQGFGMEKKT